MSILPSHPFDGNGWQPIRPVKAASFPPLAKIRSDSDLTRWAEAELAGLVQLAETEIIDEFQPSFEHEAWRLGFSLAVAGIAADPDSTWGEAAKAAFRAGAADAIADLETGTRAMSDAWSPMDTWHDAELAESGQRGFDGGHRNG